MRRRLITTAVCLAALALVPAAAQAASLSYEGTTLVYRAAPGERNNPILDKSDDGSLLVSDSGATVTLPAGCTQDYDWVPASCTMPAAVRLELGDGDDSAGFGSSMPAIPVSVLGGDGKDLLKGYGATNARLDGGAGNDTLQGWDTNETLLGGPGDDAIDGGAGDDHLEGGDGNDTLRPDTFADPGNDYVDGGTGFDTVDDYTIPSDDYHPPVSLVMDGVANDGRPGESDNVLNIEKIESHVSGTFSGGPGNDEFRVYANLDEGNSTLRGNAGNDKLTAGDYTDTLDGGAGDDVLTGGLGNDTITGGPGRDAIYGDATGSTCGLYECTVPFGNDVIDARDGESDTIDCGVGNDRAIVDAVDTVANCETVEVPSSGGGGVGGGVGGGGGGVVDTPKPRLTVPRATLGAVVARGLRVTVACPVACRATGTLRLKGKAVGTGKAKLGRGGKLRLKVALTGKGRKALRHARRAKLTLVVKAVPASGAPVTLHRTLTLKR